MPGTGFNRTVEKIADAVQGQLQGNSVTVSGVSIDTRTLRHGDLFVAISGPNFDGHDFIDAAKQQGAAAVLVTRKVMTDLPQLIVADTRIALGQLAKHWRQQFTIPVLAITGSNGKTTVKEMLTSILSQQGSVLATQGNLNNDFGVPLTLLRIDKNHKFAVIEMGANHHHEIEYLVSLALPDVALITNAGPAHLEGFGDLDGVAEAKSEIYAGLSNTGTAIINADDQYAAYWQQKCAGKNTLTFGMQHQADVAGSSRNDGTNTYLSIVTTAASMDVKFALPGQHNMLNALAAAAAAQAIDVPLADICAGLQSIQPVKGRLQLKQGLSGSRIIDDTYNANPASFNAALDVLATYPGIHYVALGDMGELGENAINLHKQAGEYACESGVTKLFTIGELAQHAAKSFGNGAYSYTEQPDMVSDISAQLSSEVTLLVKGSRRMQMDCVVNQLVYDNER